VDGVQEHLERDEVVELIRREARPEEHDEIRELWKRHSIAEDNRDLPALISAFPDIHFDLTDIVIGPQGVCEEARVTGTHRAKWLDYEPTGERLEWRVVIFFPWDRKRRRFKGEKVYTDADVWSQSATR
jgi:predicted ester cyclase